MGNGVTRGYAKPSAFTQVQVVHQPLTRKKRRRKLIIVIPPLDVGKAVSVFEKFIRQRTGPAQKMVTNLPPPPIEWTHVKSLGAPKLPPAQSTLKNE